ncbi:MAG: hypothetical protein MJ189_01780 [Coriobacteriales bacterium]|nr:hypothetical protein [Coriobacteriales bacterium]
MDIFVEKLTPELFEDMVAFAMEEPYAMGGGGHFTIYKKNGDQLIINYTDDKTPWNELREIFTDVKKMYFNGPAANEKEEEGTIKFGDDFTPTHVCEGYKHYYGGMGNHFVVKEKYPQIIKVLDDYEINVKQEGYDLMSFYMNIDVSKYLEE